MFDVQNIRHDFPMLDGKTMQGHPLAYLDNGATTLKPQCVIDAVCDYYQNYSANAHRGDYDLSHEVDEHYEHSREIVRNFIHAKRVDEVVFTSGATDALNLVAFGYAKKHLKKDDEILITVAEHASNILPWFAVAKETGAHVSYIDLDSEGRLTIENVIKAINKKTKIISIASITNVLGFEAPIQQVCEYAHQKGIIVVVDGAQSVPHVKTDVQALDVDFLAFSGHKMCGPTGIGVLYGKYDLLCDMDPSRLGGGSNARFSMDCTVSLKNPPYKFEAGTPHIAGAIGLGAAIVYLESIGMTEIQQYEKELRAYCIEKMKTLDNVEIYNENADGPISFNIKGVFSQDAASLFNKYGVAVRSGHHCAKLLEQFLHISTTLRASFYFYNTKEEIDQFIEACKKGDDFLDAFFG